MQRIQLLLQACKQAIKQVMASWCTSALVA
jgi:hypothetical protein